jgi:hypothetical protein
MQTGKKISINQQRSDILQLLRNFNYRPRVWQRIKRVCKLGHCDEAAAKHDDDWISRHRRSACAVEPSSEEVGNDRPVSFAGY